MEYAELEAGLLKRPELLGEILEKQNDAFLKNLTDNKKMVVMTTADLETANKKLIGDTTKKLYDSVDEKVTGIRGKARETNVNTLTSLDELKAEIETLRASKNKNDSTADTQAKDQAIKNLEKELRDLKTELSTEKQGVFKARVDADVNAQIGSLKFRMPADIKDDAGKQAYLKDTVAANKARFYADYKPEAMTDGRILYKDAQGTAQVDSAGNPLSPAQIFEKNHSHLLTPKGHSQGGSGSSEGSHENSGSEGWLGATTAEISSKLSEMGLEMGTDAWEKARSKAHDLAGYKKQGSIWVK